MTTQDQQLMQGRNPSKDEGSTGLAITGGVLSAVVVATAVGMQVL